MTKKRRKFKFVKLLLFIIFCVICYYLLSFLNINTKSVEIKGNDVLSDYEILKQAKLDNYPSFITTFSHNVKKRLLKNEYIANVNVTKGFLKFKINIKEKKVLYIDNETNKKVTIDSSFKDKKEICAPILTGSILSDKLSTFKKNMNKIDKNILCQMSEIKYEPNDIDEDRYFVYMNDGNGVYLTLNKFKKINKYNKIIENVGKQNGILYLDYGDYFKAY